MTNSKYEFSKPDSFIINFFWCYKTKSILFIVIINYDSEQHFKKFQLFLFDPYQKHKNIISGKKLLSIRYIESDQKQNTKEVQNSEYIRNLI
jgi:hypothetical protein